MTDFRYPQFCAIARAAEILGERWTLLILRELFLGPQRFSDLRRRLSGVSPSVLTTRLEGLERRGIIEKCQLQPPAPATVYRFAEAGRALTPILSALAEWGSRFLLPRRPGEQLVPEHFRFALGLCARKTPTPARSIELRATQDENELIIRVQGGSRGTRVDEKSAGASAAEVVVRGAPLDIIAVATRTVPERPVEISGRVRSRESLAALFDELFDFPTPPGGGQDETDQPNPKGDTA